MFKFWMLDSFHRMHVFLSKIASVDFCLSAVRAARGFEDEISLPFATVRSLYHVWHVSSSALAPQTQSHRSANIMRTPTRRGGFLSRSSKSWHSHRRRQRPHVPPASHRTCGHVDIESKFPRNMATRRLGCLERASNVVSLLQRSEVHDLL